MILDVEGLIFLPFGPTVFLHVISYNMYFLFQDYICRIMTPDLLFLVFLLFVKYLFYILGLLMMRKRRRHKPVKV